MNLEGIHHITAITGDGSRNVEFYAGVLGLRMVKKTVNQDDPTAYHLFYADELGSHGADLTFFEYPGLPPGRPGAGMVSRIVHRVASEDSLGYWAERLAGADVETIREPGRLLFSDPEGLGHELAVVATSDAPLIAHHAEVPPEHALQGFEAVRAAVADPARSEALVQAMGFSELAPHDFEARGPERGGRIVFETASERHRPGAGTVHHVAWSALAAELADWRGRVAQAGAEPTPVIDRYYFESVYFREPGGILYELATGDGNGFAVDEPLAHLGEKLSLPPAYEHLRPKIEPVLRPLPDPRRWRPPVNAPVGG